MQDDSASASGRKPSLERRLATILMADVVGYSKMMGENEERTIEVLRGHREIFDEMLKIHRGRIFNTAGDAILAEFPSAVDAVRCATEVQAALRTRNDHLPPEQRMLFRIGVNLGDVIVQDRDLLGDGVNVAARIQTVAEPGGVCISGSVYDQIQNKLSLQFRQMGEQNFKNIAQPVRTFSITDSDAPPPRTRRVTNGRLIASVLAVVTLVGAGSAYLWYRDHESKLADQARIADAQRKVEQDRAAAEAAQHEATLQAELQAAKDALQQAEAAKRKSEQERLAAETAQREARLQGELKAAKDALQRAEQSEKKADLDAKSAAAALLSAEKASRMGARANVRNAGVASTVAGSAPPAASAPVASAARPPSDVPRGTVSPKAAVAAGESAAFDGNYQGRFCNSNEGKAAMPRCWKSLMTVQQGRMSSTWTSRFNENPTNAKGAIGADGSANLVIDGFRLDGQPQRATMAGSVTGDKITLSGSWRSGIGITANLTRVH
jgi:class 3 adenylate cyclase